MRKQGLMVWLGFEKGTCDLTELLLLLVHRDPETSSLPNSLHPIAETTVTMTGTLFGDNGERPRPPLSLIHQLLSYLYFHSHCQEKMLKKRKGSTILENLREGLETQPIYFNRQRRRRRRKRFLTFRKCSQLLPTFTNFCQHLATSDNFLQLLPIFVKILQYWQLLPIFGNICQHMATFGNICVVFQPTLS